jgi:hypothetical protein
MQVINRDLTSTPVLIKDDSDKLFSSKLIETSNGLTGIGSPAYLNLLFAPQPDLKPLAPKLYF